MKAILYHWLNNAQNNTPQNIELPDISHEKMDYKQFLPLFNAILFEGKKHHQPDWAAHMTPAIGDASLIGQLLATLHNGNLLSPEHYPLLAKIEQRTLDWLCKQFYFPHGHFTHGSSYGNLEALWQAREASDLIHKNPQRRTVYASQAAHYSIAKSCRLLGLDFQAIPSDAQDKINIDALKSACALFPPLAIIATAGTATAGQIDAIQACADLAKTYNAWLHIDAAWGGALVFSPEQKQYLAGIEQADSLCFDPHKTLAQPKPTSVLCYRQAITAQWHEKVDYLHQQPPSQFIGSHGAELCLSLWSYLIIEGADSIARATQQRLIQAQIFADGLKPIADTIIHSPTGIVCFSLPTTANIDDLISRGVFSRAKINQQPIYRAVFADPSCQADSLLATLRSVI